MLFLNEPAVWPKCITCLPEADRLRMTALQTDSSLFALCLSDFVLLSWKNPVVYHKGVVVHNRTGWPLLVHESFFRRPVLRMATLKTASSLIFALCRCSVVAEDDVWCHKDVCHVLKRTGQVTVVHKPYSEMTGHPKVKKLELVLVGWHVSSLGIPHSTASNLCKVLQLHTRRSRRKLISSDIDSSP